MVKENVTYSDGFIEIWFHFPRHFNGNKRQYMRNYFLQIEENYKFLEEVKAYNYLSPEHSGENWYTNIKCVPKTKEEKYEDCLETYFNT